MAGPFPMHRLLQGDVGSGKTVVALAALLAAVQSGHQGALMVPTEVLAEQHISAVRALLGDLEGPGGMARRRGAGRAADEQGEGEGARGGARRAGVGRRRHRRRDPRAADRGGRVRARSACVVIDEQHRFGVEQRATLRAKGADGDPDLLVMTATPIPRTAAMVIFGDLDLTTLDELPPGRTPVTTEWLPAEDHAGQASAWDRVRARWRRVTGPSSSARWSGSRLRVEAKSATEEYERLSAGELAGLQVGLHARADGARGPRGGHGPLPGRRAQVLVATTVIEVGVDVPEATVMVIESADRFGIAQLHQLRGRVGRGHAASWCYLLGGEEGNERLAGRGGHDRRLRAGRGGPARPGRGHAARRPPEGPERPATGVADRPGRPRPLGGGAPGGRGRRRRGPAARRRTPGWPTRSRLLLSEDEGEYLFKS